MVAWHKEKPISHLLIDWAGATDPSVLAVVKCPNIKHVFVHPSYQERGIGSKLIKKAEAIAKTKGIFVIGLGVGVDNISARKLYLRLGYEESGVPKLRNLIQYVDYELGAVDYKEDVIYLIKRL